MGLLKLCYECLCYNLKELLTFVNACLQHTVVIERSSERLGSKLVAIEQL